MGYRFPSAVFPLEFKAGQLAGLEVECRTGSVAQYQAIARLSDARDVAPDTLLIRLCEAFAGSLLRWNLEAEDGAPVPPTYAGLVGQDVELVMTVIDTWLDAVLARRRAETATEADREAERDAWELHESYELLS